MLEAKRFHELLIAARDVVRVAVGIQALKVGGDVLVAIFNRLPVFRILLGDPWWYCLANSADPCQVSVCLVRPS